GNAMYRAADLPASHLFLGLALGAFLISSRAVPAAQPDDSNVDANRPVDFANEIVPLLSRYGCNAGGCHGKASGQNGFKLSLFGLDPAFDYIAIVKEARGRRVFPAAPDHSLLLTKPTGRVPHGGGKRFPPDSEAYLTLRRWIAQGLPASNPRAPV